MKKLDGGFKPLDPVIDHEAEPESRKNDGSSLAQLLRRLEEGLPNTFDQEMISAGTQLRKLNAPRAETAAKTRKGVWVGESFVLADEYVPEKYNDKKRTIAQIKKDLSETYGIHVDSISYIDGIADFRPISVAHIPTADIVKRATGINDKKYESLSQLNRTRLFQKVFSAERDGVSKRERNFDLADQLTAERQIQIPGLEAGYSATDLKAWRSKNNFSWDEQVSGYHLVPTIIHGNLPHTGLVSTAKNAYSYLKRRKQDLAAHPEKYCWDEQTAPISIDEAKVLAKKQNRKTKGGSDMAMRRVYSRGMNLGRREIAGYDQLDNETKEQLEKRKDLIGLGKKLEADKAKLESLLERVIASSINAEDKQKMIDEINAAFDKLKAQYEQEVTEKIAETEKTAQEQLAEMEQAVSELDDQAGFLRSVSMDAASTDASAAADAADEKKQEFEQMKQKYVQDLQLQMQQAEIQRRNMQNRDSSGN